MQSRNSKYKSSPSVERTVRIVTRIATKTRPGDDISLPFIRPTKPKCFLGTIAGTRFDSKLRLGERAFLMFHVPLAFNLGQVAEYRKSASVQPCTVLLNHMSVVLLCSAWGEIANSSSWLAHPPSLQRGGSNRLALPSVFCVSFKMGENGVDLTLVLRESVEIAQHS